ncbi:MAG TPA: Fe(3+)-hydroxamate ABC transporter permease FhuB [Ensifer sp.]|nr:Fe(3+)-hydroxamate ABC transporter permease FhuB [Ensifer sp.]
MTEILAHRRIALPQGPAVMAAMLLVVAAGLSLLALTPVLFGHDADAMSRLVLVHSTLPRVVVAILCGAGLGLAGALLQLALKNPLASPATLGVSAGANLAIVVAMVFSPALLDFGRDAVALGGSALAAALVLSLGARQGFSPFSLILAGLIVSLWCGALAAILVLLNERYIASLFIWGAGSLSQQSWHPALALLPKLFVLGALSALLIRPLTLLETGDATARALGMKVERMRLLQVGLAVSLSAIVVSAVGVISFVGLVAPAIARLSGARRPAQILLWSTVFGAGLLWLTDEAVQWLAGSMREFVPTGTVTAAIGAPILLLLLKGMKTRPRAPLAVQRRPHPARGKISARQRVLLVAVALIAVIAVCVLLGRAPNGDWVLPTGTALRDVLDLRMPRVLAAAAAGAMLATAGVILQRLTGNDLASPEILGVSAGATAGVTALLFIVSTPTLPLQLVAAVTGSLLVLGSVFLLARAGRFEPERVLMIGVSLGALVDAISGVIAANGDPRAMFLLRWMSGSTYGADMKLSTTVLVSGVFLALATLLMRRWLDILPLGPETAAGVGISLGRASFLLFLTAGGLSAAATLATGPLSFVGLMGPHLARLLGFRSARAQIWGGIAAGSGIMLIADWLGRTLVFPYEIPAGLVASLIGAPMLVLLMRRRG